MAEEAALLEVEPDAGDQSVIDAILSTKEAPKAPPKAAAKAAKEPPREPPVEGDQPSEEPEQTDQPDQDEPVDEKETGEEEEGKAKEEAGDEDVDIDNLLVEVTINGEKKDIPLKDLKNSYSGAKYIEQNVQKAVEIRKAVEYNAAALYQANQAAVEKLKSLDSILDTVGNPNIDWDALRARNPNEYLLKREEQREIAEKQRLVQQEVERINAEQAALQSQSRQRMVVDQAQLLADRLPDLADPKKAPQVMGRLVKTAEYFGFQKPEIDGVVDHRQMLVLWAAANWLHDQYERAQVRQKANGDASASAVPPKKVVLRPGSSQNSAANSQKRLTADAYNRARKSGSVEDVAQTLILATPRRR